jgi:hypothetical protein
MLLVQAGNQTVHCEDLVVACIEYSRAQLTQANKRIVATATIQKPRMVQKLENTNSLMAYDAASRSVQVFSAVFDELVDTVHVGAKGN